MLKKDFKPWKKEDLMFLFELYNYDSINISNLTSNSFKIYTL